MKDQKEKNVWMIWILLACCLSGCGKSGEAYFMESTEDTQAVSYNFTEESTEEPSARPPADCCVHICGAVRNPGVYSLPSGSRIYEAIAKAGGLSAEACQDSVNQAETITDGQMIRIPTEEEAAMQEEPPQADQTGQDGRINLNTADADALMTLPGIGASKAKSILAYREAQGGFSSIEDIMNITGIKEGVYTKIKDYITVN